MKNRLILVTGGARSGKSAFAERLLCDVTARRAYIATCPVLDDEMRERVRRHRENRAAANWLTIEEQFDPGAALRRAEEQGCDGALIDCLTLWLSNLFFRAEQRNEPFGEAEAAVECEKLLPQLRAFPGTVVAVLNEVGSGVVPESPLGRRFRDASGRCGQLIAASADELFLAVCGIAIRIK